jgi:hypothetical protein
VWPELRNFIVSGFMILLVWAVRMRCTLPPCVASRGDTRQYQDQQIQMRSPADVVCNRSILPPTAGRKMKMETFFGLLTLTSSLFAQSKATLQDQKMCADAGEQGI